MHSHRSSPEQYSAAGSHQGLLDGIMAVDGGRQAGAQLLQRRRVLRQRLDVLQVACAQSSGLS
jgi:hypothetical protein